MGKTLREAGYYDWNFINTDFARWGITLGAHNWI
jgi:hypothetical protein